MITAQDIFLYIDSIAPFGTAIPSDNPGFLLRCGDRPVTGLLLTLDVTNATSAQAVSKGCELVVSHHPLIWEPLRAVDHTMPVFSLIRHNISVISAHTNLDCAAGGVGDTLAACLSLTAIAPFSCEGEPVPIGRVGTLPHPMEPRAFGGYVKEKLGCAALHGTFGPGRIHKVAVIGGAGGKYWGSARACGADACVTADVGHHQFLLAREQGFTLLDAGHFETERPVLWALKEKLNKRFPKLSVHIAHEESPIVFI